jgi:hypothetical protein
MTTIETTVAWPLWRKIAFRFFFIYIILQTSPLSWIARIPGVGYVVGFYFKFIDWAVTVANAKIFHITNELVQPNGSGDTSWGWAYVCFIAGIAILGCVIWSVLDRQRANYMRLNYWLCLLARYYLAMFAFDYGILKILALQMPFPNMHQLATPLGDLLPMRLSWMFIGYSKTYQVFSGVMELMVGILLINRRTATLGVLMATAVFANVMMLNLSYDIPVKIFSMQLTFISLFLLANEGKRLFYFFVLNKPASIGHAYHFSYAKLWMRISRVVLKVGFVIVAVVMVMIDYWGYYQSVNAVPAKQPFKNGVYAITAYTVNKKEVPATLTDSIRWQDMILENGTGSIKTADTLFRQRYKRGYFAYTADTLKHLLSVTKMPGDSIIIMSLNYQLPDQNTIKLWGKMRNDSLYIELKRTNRHFQLAEKQFHWLSEHNR